MSDNQYHEVQGEHDILRYGSWGEFVNHGDIRESTHGAPSSRKNSHEYDYLHNGSGAWHGTYTWSEAMELATKGWSEGSNKVRALSKVLIERVTSLVERHTIDYGVTGIDFDMGMYLQGEPEHWYTINSHIEQGEGKRVLKMVYNCSASAGISTEVITAKGATIAALIECLEFSGYRVELILNEAVKTSYTGANSTMQVWVPIKAADQYLDMDRLSFALAHPATLRRFMFAAQESVKRFVQKCGSSYGMPTSTPKGTQADVLIEKSFLGEPQWTNEESACSWVLGQLQKQGVQVTRAEAA